MKKMGIFSVADHDIRKVSGGQLQRAAICRAMINHPDILFGDEPTGALDSSSTKEVMDILEQINFSNSFNCSQAVFTIFATEMGIDEELALKIATQFGGGARKGEIC